MRNEFLDTHAVIDVSDVDSTISANGKIVTSDAEIVIQPVEMSVVRSVAVKMGQQVKAGEVLATLDPTFTEADKEELAGATLADDPGQPNRGAHVGQEPVAGFGQADLRALCEDTEVARQGKLQTGAVGVAPHGGDAGAAQVRNPAERLRRGRPLGERTLVGRPLGPVGQRTGDTLDQVDASGEARPFPGYH